MSNGNDKDEFLHNEGAAEGGEAEGAPLETGAPAVASAPGRMIFVLLLAAVFIFIVVRSLFFSGSPPKEEPKPTHKDTVVAAPPTPSIEISSQGAFPAPPPPEPVAATPPPPPPPPVLTAPPTPEVHVSKGPDDEALKARIHSSMIMSGGTGSKSLLGSKSQGKSATSVGNDPNSAFAQSVAQSDGAGRVDATKMGDLNITIAQGKIIQGILETAINSDLPGPIRAIVSHDVYAEMGRDVLIPKGSRLIGTYNASIRKGQARVFIIWTRVIRPDGVDVAIDSPGIDALGRAGSGGDVDNKYFEMFSTALLTSSLDIGVAAAGDGLFGNQEQTTTTGGGGTTTTSSPTATAMQQAVSNIGDVGKSITGNVLNLSPTISIDQGTPVNVFVNHDLVFPYGIHSQSRFIE